MSDKNSRLTDKSFILLHEGVLNMSMKYREIGKTGMIASVLTLGTWEMGGGSVWSDFDDNESIRIIHEAQANGINSIDTAPLYGMGHAEELLNKAVKGRRSDFIISSKFSLNWDNRGEFQFERDGYALCADFSRAGIIKDLDGCLTRLGTDYLDIFFAHRNIPQEYVPEAIDTLKDLKRQGKIRAIGLSNVFEGQFREFLQQDCLDIIQQKYSILDTEYGNAFFKDCEKYNVTYHAYSVLARGILTGRLDAATVVDHQAHQAFGWFELDRRRDLLAMLDGWKGLCEKYRCSLANLALAWTLEQSEALNIIFGVRKIKNLHDTLKAIDISMEREDLRQMLEDANRLRKKYKEAHG
jgi:methylglyoxal reductase